MPAPLTQEQATALRDKGAITPDTYRMLYPEELEQTILGGGNAPAPVQPAPSIEPTPAAAPAPAPSGPPMPMDAAPLDVAPPATRVANDSAMQSARVARERAEDAPPAATPASTTEPRTMAGASTGGGAGQDVLLASDGRPVTGYATRDTPTAGVDRLLGGATSGLDMMAEGVRMAARTGEAKAAEQSAFLARTAKEDEERVKAIEAEQKGRQVKLDAKLKELDTEAARLGTLKVDPQRFWATRTTGDKVMAGIGLFLGAFGSGPGNRAVSVIQSAIDRDIDAQKSNIANQKDAYTAKTGIYKDMLAQFKDARAAEEATRMAYLSNAELKVKEIEARYAGPEVKAKAQQLLGEIQQKKMEARANFLKAMAPYLQGPVDGNANPELMTQEQRDRFVPGYGLALTKEDAGKLKEQAGAVSEAKSNVRELKAILDMPGKSLSPEQRSRATVLAGMLKGSLRTLLVGPGAVTENEQKLMDKIIADPTAIFSLDSSSKAALNTLTQTLDRNLAQKVKTYMPGGRSAVDKLNFTAATK